MFGTDYLGLYTNGDANHTSPYQPCLLALAKSYGIVALALKAAEGSVDYSA
jgi:hypothetical protein